jgi:predicted small metal-binding protein
VWISGPSGIWIPPGIGLGAGETRVGPWTDLELTMALRLVCMCGYVIQGDDDDELWRNAQDHMGVLHPELVDEVSREDLLAQAELV